jgi:hypothetical protein
VRGVRPRSLLAAALPAPSLTLKRILVFFWAMYLSLVSLTNIVDLLDAIAAIDWKFLNSGNFDYMRSVVKVYAVGSVPTKLLLAGALLVEVIGACLFWRAVADRTARPAMQALCYASAVWIAFIFMTEFFVAYASESVFQELLLLIIGPALFVALVPE